MGSWYYSKNGCEIGPVSAASLKSLFDGGKLSPTNLVRRETSSEWQSAGRVKGLFPADIAMDTPPPLPSEATVIQPGIMKYLLNHWRETRGTLLAPLLLGISPVLILSILKPLLTWENEVVFAILILILSGTLFLLYLFSQMFEYMRGRRSVTSESSSRLSFWSHQLACFVVLMLLPFLTVEYFMNQRGIVVTMIPGIRVLQDDLFSDRQLPSLLDSLREWRSSITLNESLVETEQSDTGSADRTAPESQETADVIIRPVRSTFEADKEFQIAASHIGDRETVAAGMLVGFRNDNKWSWQRLDSEVNFQFRSLKQLFLQWKQDRISAGDRYN